LRDYSHVESNVAGFLAVRCGDCESQRSGLAIRDTTGRRGKVLAMTRYEPFIAEVAEGRGMDDLRHKPIQPYDGRVVA
jgi:hypothetical protein